MKKLLIVESPAKIKTISKFLGNDFKIMSTIGHIVDLPTKGLGVKINGTIEIDYAVVKDKEKVIADICKEAHKADEIFLAPDPDREGEIIAWHVNNEIKKVIKKNARVYRIAFNEITKTAITEAIKNPGIINQDKVSAQQARRVLDRWVGYEVSPILWRKIAKGLSAGRVQSVALKLICDREDAIRAFKTEEYWSIELLFIHKNGSIKASLTQINKKKVEIKNEQDARAIAADLTKTNFTITDIQDKERNSSAPSPFMTSTLQQGAYNRLGFSVKKTMQVAQQMYEGVTLDDASTPVALITYMRTDSLRISDTAVKQVREFVKKTYGSEYLPSKANVYAKGKAQDAHEAIRPIDVTLTPEMIKKYVTADIAKLYELIWRRFVACQMTPAKYAQRHVLIAGGPYISKVTGSTLLFDGYLKAYTADEDEDSDKVILPKNIEISDSVKTKDITPKQHFTQPPPRFSEGSLVKELEKEGIGRPSTYGAILNTIRARAYTTLDTKKRFSPTELGMTVTKLLNEYLPKIMNVQFTALMEEDLDKIAHGQMDRDTLLREFYDSFKKDLDAFSGQDISRTAETTQIECPECKKGKLIVRFGKTGHFAACQNYPECKFTSNFARNESGEIELIETAKPTLLDEACLKCGKPLRTAFGKFGPFVACSGYPDCKFIKQEVAPFPCPKDEGEVVQRSWRGGKFWGCKNYPKCNFAVFGELVFEPCPDCKSVYLIKKITKKDGTTIRCPNKECNFIKKVTD